MTNVSSEPHDGAPQADSIGRLSELISGDPMTRLDADMKHLLDTLGALGARPLEHSTPKAARRQPRASDAVAAILARQDRPVSEDGIIIKDIAIPNAVHLR